MASKIGRMSLPRSLPGEPDPRKWPVVATGAKVGYCLMDLGSCTGQSGHCRTDLGLIFANSLSDMISAPHCRLMSCFITKSITDYNLKNFGEEDIISMGGKGRIRPIFS